MAMLGGNSKFLLALGILVGGTILTLAFQSAPVGPTGDAALTTSATEVAFVSSPTETFTHTPSATFTASATASLTATQTASVTTTRIQDLGIITATPLPTLTASPTTPPSDTPAPLITATPADESADAPTATLYVPSIAPLPTLPSAVLIPHVVQPGETLNKLARQYGVSVEAIAEANQLTRLDNIQVGQTILIPFIPDQVAMGLTATVDALTPSTTPTLTWTPSETPTLPPTPSETATRRGSRLITATTLPTFTDTPPPTKTPLPSPTPLPRTDINGVTLASMLVMPEPVKQHVRDIFACGIKLGVSQHSFAKLGDCNFEPPFFVTRFDQTGAYNLGEYGYLQGVIDHYSGSFGRNSVGVHRGMHSWSMFDPMWADKTQCQPNESVVACEFRIQRPSVVLIRLGTNDGNTPQYFEKHMRRLVEFAIAKGAIPIVGTKADRVEGANNTVNLLVRQIALDYNIPLWDVDLLASTLPRRGLDLDGIHMTVYPQNDFSAPLAFARGHGVQNLSALMILDAVLQEANSGSGNAVPSCGVDVK